VAGFESEHLPQVVRLLTVEVQIASAELVVEK
jgi:hypothetical protein